MQHELIAEFRDLVGHDLVVTSPADLSPLTKDWRGRYEGQALCAVYPRSTEEVAAIVRLCAARGVGVVPQGGNTGMCGAATPVAGEQVIVRLDRLNKVRHLSGQDNTIVVEAGCILADIQRAADSIDRLFPMSLGAEGSCQIGGNIATNAGGTAVLRYGPMRDLVLGLEVVLPSGEIFRDLKRLRKDNTGYAVRHLFIGAEGTLGLITAASLKLFAKPRTSATAMATVTGLDNALALLAVLRERLGDRIGAFEVMSESQLALVCEHIPGSTRPFRDKADWYVLVEVDDVLISYDLAGELEAGLSAALEKGFVEDVIIPSSQAQAAALWRLRHSVSEANVVSGVSASYDSAVPLDRQAEFVAKVSAAVSAAFPAARLLYVGHLGDGNVHVIAHFDKGYFPSKTEFEAAAAVINDIVDGVTIACDGSISAEHGIGISNRARLARSIDPVRLTLMKQIKALLDPTQMMNAGKLFVDADAGLRRDVRDVRHDHDK